MRMIYFFTLQKKTIAIGSNRTQPEDNPLQHMLIIMKNGLDSH